MAQRTLPPPRPWQRWGRARHSAISDTYSEHPAVTASEPPDAATDVDEQLQRALELGYRYLNRRDRTETEIRRRLEQADVTPTTIDHTLAILVDQGVVNDSRFARLFVEDKRTLDRWGNDRIRRALIQRGIDRALIEATLADGSTEDELARALELLRARFPRPPQDRRERDRALGVMLRKGYDGELAVDALAAYAHDPSDVR
jgi:regulatory protein